MKLRAAILLLFLSNSLLSKDIHWKGNTGNWTDASQWENNVIPTPNDNAIITAGIVIISKKQKVEVNQIQLLEGAKIENNGHILITDASRFAIKIDEFSIFKNLKKGIIEIKKATENGIQISNRGMLLNSGKVLVGAPVFGTGKRGKQIGGDGLVLDNQAIFRNNKFLEVQNTLGKAIIILNESVFTNHKKILLGGTNSLLQRHGVQNEGVFTNNKKGKIYIDGTYLDGIRNENSGLFDNIGKIYLGKIKSVSSYGIYCADNADFRNQKQGKVYFYTTRNGQTKKSGAAKITNEGKFKIKKK